MMGRLRAAILAILLPLSPAGVAWGAEPASETRADPAEHPVRAESFDAWLASALERNCADAAWHPIPHPMPETRSMAVRQCHWSPASPPLDDSCGRKNHPGLRDEAQATRASAAQPAPKPVETVATACKRADQVLPAAGSPPPRIGSPPAKTEPPGTGQTENHTGSAGRGGAALPLPDSCAATVLESVPTRQKAVALTIDLGESLEPDALRGILEDLEARRLHVTFFVTGWFIRHHPDLLDEICSRGHDLGNHTDTHPDCRRVTAERLREELAAVERLLRARGRGGAMSRPQLWRPPFGEYDDRVVRVAAEAGYRTVAWSATSLDYEPGASPERVARTILRHTAPGGIILCHATGVSQRAIPKVLEALESLGYGVMTVRELLSCR